MANKHSSLIYRWMEEVWNKGREEAIDELMDAQAKVHGIEGINTPGPEGFKPFFKTFRQQFPQIQVEIEEVVCEGDLETARCIVKGTSANGQEVNFTGMTCVRMKDGKIAEGWNNFDFLSMYQQLGFKMQATEAMPA